MELTLLDFKKSVKEFIQELNNMKIPELYGITDGKAVGTYVEQRFNRFLQSKYLYTAGNSASGIDFPELQIDLKVTSIKQPQSSCPFRDAAQKVYGLGYNLLILVYEKNDSLELRECKLHFQNAVFVESECTGDYQTTYGIIEILRRNGNKDDLVAFFEERNLPLDEIGRDMLAERILLKPPKLGYLTISNALQWRLQYSRIITVATTEKITGVENLLV
jgi:hypothetical protein